MMIPSTKIMGLFYVSIKSILKMKINVEQKKADDFVRMGKEEALIVSSSSWRRPLVILQTSCSYRHLWLPVDSLLSNCLLFVFYDLEPQNACKFHFHIYKFPLMQNNLLLQPFPTPTKKKKKTHLLGNFGK